MYPFSVGSVPTFASAGAGQGADGTAAVGGCTLGALNLGAGAELKAVGGTAAADGTASVGCGGPGAGGRAGAGGGFRKGSLQMSCGLSGGGGGGTCVLGGMNGASEEDAPVSGASEEARSALKSPPKLQH